MEVWPGSAYPLGATYNGTGTNFALFSERAEKVELCLFDDDGKETRINLDEVDGYVWHCYIPQIQPGQKYGYRVHGAYDPASGNRFNPNKLLLDPYAKAVHGQVDWDPSLFTYNLGEPDSINNEDSASHMMMGVVINPFFDWDGDQNLRIPYHQSVIYEAHVKGLTQLHPEIPEEQRGTYAGVAHPAVISHLQKLGVTAIELMPVHQFVNDGTLQDKGLNNYWGYNTIGFFAPQNTYSSTGDTGQQVQDFKAMVRSLHKAGIEVILDVVYNHTAEGNHLGPTLSFKGIDNAAYYRLMEGDEKHYMDYTGTGNSLNVRQPHSLQLLMDSLRYWVTEMHVDGFRFDLASTLARASHEFDPQSPFFAVLRQDPVLSPRVLIAEPWDLGDTGYQVGGFPPGWAEWNDQYRDTMRAYWKGDGGLIGDFARRLTGSHDLYGTHDRGPIASVNFVTAHDGFTLNDLVSYNDKHNEANGEENRDGSDNNVSWNCGAEGPTQDAEINKLREQQKRNFLATLLVSQGIPMITAGDEVGRTQGGNNNAYCQDNEINWHDWYWDDARWSLLNFTKKLIRMRREHPIFRRRDFFLGVPVGDSGRKDVAWLKPDGHEMTPEEWEKEFARSLGMWLYGDHLPESDLRGRPLHDDSFLVLFNAHHDQIDFTLPALPEGWGWRTDVDTSFVDGTPAAEVSMPQGTYPLQGRSLAVLREISTKDQ
jgi:glycogen operon protein